ncbi:sodium:proton exchanger [Wenjunlia vitaminophila]|uniref:Sodium:proton exchanger n=1 Tax=Wenjunlia vitaminophila TaxID=76728 RepID=A0A0T6LX53_WENVI|nr:cation:proton antiporter [Wenjunlia vitaminophila]KRV50637.1 sodium:proton exchanger [Wenjunlia vitaminophila]
MSKSEHAEWIVTVTIGDIALVLAVATVFVMLARRIKQPAVIGEITAGICLGPSLLGLFPGDLPNRLFPAEVRPFLNVVSQVGLLLFMFIIGWEFDASTLRGRRKSVGGIWLCSIGLPLSLGMGLAALIYGAHDSVNGNSVDMLDFCLYLGVAMSITAFPVLARIISDQRLQFSRVGTLALALAAADDVLAWCMLAFVVALVTASGTGAFVGTLVWSVVYVCAMLLVVRPLLAWTLRRATTALRPYLAVLVAAGVFCSAYITSEIGIHAIFGAFLFGIIMPRDTDGTLREVAMVPLEQAGKLLLPLFFVVTGLNVDLTTMSASGLWEMLAIIAVACLAKLGGVAIPARLSGMDWREASTLGLLMNTRGLTELIILNVGLSLGVLDTQLFSAMVIMALFTTAMAAPLLSMSLAKEREEAMAAQAAAGTKPVGAGAAPVAADGDAAQPDGAAGVRQRPSSQG